MSDEKKHTKHGVKINKMTKAQALAAVAKCEVSNDRESVFYAQCKRAARSSRK